MRRLFIIVLVIVLGAFAYVNYRKSNRLETSLKQVMEQQQASADAQNIAKAKEIIGKVRRHMEIATDPEPTVAAIVDVNALKAKSEFYNNARNGDYLIVTMTRAILYAPDKDLIVDVVPVELQPAPAPASKPAQ